MRFFFALTFLFFSCFATLEAQVTHNGSISGNPLWSYNNVTQSGGGAAYISLANVTGTSSGGLGGIDISPGSFTSPNLVINASSTLMFEGRTFNGYCDPSTSNDIVVEISEDGGSSFSFLALFEPTTNVLTAYSVMLPASSIGQNDIQIRFSSGGPTSSTNGNNCIACAANSGACIVKTAGVDNISISNAILPITLVYFNAYLDRKSVNLTFSTASEHNNSHFSIERSADGRTFETIGQQRGAGNAYEPQNYTYTDEHPLKGINYYRLKQVDFDGAYTYSRVVSIAFGQSGHIRFSPSPATDLLQVLLEEPAPEGALYEVFDQYGRFIKNGTFVAESNTCELDLSMLPQGSYLFRLVYEQSVLSKQFLKQ